MCDCNQQTKSYIGTAFDQQIMGIPAQTNAKIGYDKRPSLREESEKQVGYHRAEADKYDRAIAFFRENPAFDEFVQLVRSGVI
jgi:hypothetical protein